MHIYLQGRFFSINYLFIIYLDEWMNLSDYSCIKCYNLLSSCKKCSSPLICLECYSGIVNPSTY